LPKKLKLKWKPLNRLFFEFGNSPMHADTNETPQTYAYIAWTLALVGTLGSLFLSDVMELPPCSLCWYQRICLFPLTLILAVGIVLRDTRIVHYGAPLLILGLCIALYHNLLYYGVIPESLSPCTQGVPCSSKQLQLLGFIGIPLLSLGTFAAILAALWMHHRATQSSSEVNP
jgi:disulfide bond formation protein DsbB